MKTLTDEIQTLFNKCSENALELFLKSSEDYDCEVKPNNNQTWNQASEYIAVISFCATYKGEIQCWCDIIDAGSEIVSKDFYSDFEGRQNILECLRELSDVLDLRLEDMHEKEKNSQKKKCGPEKVITLNGYRYVLDDECE